MHLGCCSTFGSSIFTLSESLATSLVHGSRNPARKTIRYPFNDHILPLTYSCTTGIKENMDFLQGHTSPPDAKGNNTWKCETHAD
jgi:hypothetical protein